MKKKSFISLTGPKKNKIFERFQINLPNDVNRSCDFILNFLTFSQKCARVYRPFQSFCLWNFVLLELHLDGVLEVLLVVGLKTTKLVDKCHRKIHWKMRMIALWMAEIFFKLWKKERNKKSFQNLRMREEDIFVLLLNFFKTNILPFSFFFF